MRPIPNARAIARVEVDVAVEAAEECVRRVVAPGVELFAEAAAMEQGAAAQHTGVELNTVAAGGVKLVVIDQQSLGPARAEPLGDDLKSIVNAVAVIVEDSSDGRAIAHKQSPLAVKGDVIAAAGEFGGHSAIDPEAVRKFELVVKKRRRGTKPACGETQDAES